MRSNSLSPLGNMEAQAAASAKDVNLNVSNSIAGIGNPTSSATAWEGSKVYYAGKECFVLDKDGTVGGGHSSKSDHMLLTAAIVEYYPFDNVCSDWSVSDIRDRVNGAGSYRCQECFLWFWK